MNSVYAILAPKLPRERWCPAMAHFVISAKTFRKQEKNGTRDQSWSPAGGKEATEQSVPIGARQRRIQRVPVLLNSGGLAGGIGRDPFIGKEARMNMG